MRKVWKDAFPGRNVREQERRRAYHALSQLQLYLRHPQAHCEPRFLSEESDGQSEMLSKVNGDAHRRGGFSMLRVATENSIGENQTSQRVGRSYPNHARPSAHDTRRRMMATEQAPYRVHPRRRASVRCSCTDVPFSLYGLNLVEKVD